MTEKSMRIPPSACKGLLEITGTRMFFPPAMSDWSFAQQTIESHWKAFIAGDNNLTSWDPIFTSVLFAGVMFVVTWLLSWATGNYSQVDKLWSVLPPFYAVMFGMSRYNNARMA